MREVRAQLLPEEEKAVGLDLSTMMVRENLTYSERRAVREAGYAKLREETSLRGQLRAAWTEFRAWLCSRR